MTLMKLQKIVPALFATSLFAAAPAHAKNIKACVFDLMGKSGPAYSSMQDYALAAKGWGVNLNMKVYTDERVATEDFKAGKCDLVSVSGIRGRQFNKFVGSIDAIGATTTKKTAYTIVKMMASPKLAKKMTSGNYEVAGVIPLGAAYLFVNDRNINTLAKAAGKRFAVLDHDKSQSKMVARVGAQPVSSDITTFGSKFNNGQVDVIAAPAIAFKPLELHKGLGSKGAIVKFPILQITGNVIIRHNKFPAGYGQKSRTWVATQLPKAFKQIQTDERSIPSKYWMSIPENDKIGYVKLMREARMDMTKEGFYDKSMMRLLKKVRCGANPSSFECSLAGE